MKQLLTKRWLGIPMAVIVGLLLVALLTGGAFAAAYTFFNGGASAHVSEAITWGNAYGDGSWDNSTGQWTVNMYPGEAKSLTLGLYNAGPAALNVTVTLTGPADPALGGNGVYTVPALGGVWVPLTATASSSAAPGDYMYTISMSR